MVRIIYIYAMSAHPEPVMKSVLYERQPTAINGQEHAYLATLANVLNKHGLYYQNKKLWLSLIHI